MMIPKSMLRHRVTNVTGKIEDTLKASYRPGETISVDIMNCDLSHEIMYEVLEDLKEAGWFTKVVRDPDLDYVTIYVSDYKNAFDNC